jgi:hypothetical protein
LYSDFEELEDQQQWTNSPSNNPFITWEYEEGGKDNEYPLNAASGDLNAVFSYSSGGDTVYYRNLISPKIDLSVALKPQLSFQHAQYGGIPSHDYTYLLFKAGDGADWDTIESWHDEIPGWEEEVFVLDEIDSKYQCKDFQIAFLAYSVGIKGSCVDSVVIEEKDTLDYFVHNITYSQVDNKYLTSKAVQVPLTQVKLNVLGNNGDRNLKSISFVLNEGEDSFFKANGFKLFLTKDNTFKNEYQGASTQIGSAVSISSGVVTFSGLSEKLRIGNNYLWLTADIADDVTHNSPMVFGVNSNSLQFNDTLMPGTAIDTIFYDLIEEAVFYDNFDTDKGWDLTSSGGDFERAVPLGLSTAITEDPSYAYSGSYVLGTDLTDDGLYEKSITPSTSYYAESPELDLKYYNDVKIYMKKWIDFYFQDTAYIEITNDGGSSWNQIWYNREDNPTFSPGWGEIFNVGDADELLSHQSNVKLRFTVYKTSNTARAGFNIDHFFITGNHLEKDVGITNIISPFDDCIGYNNDTVKIEVRNYAEGASPSVIPVYYALWGLDSTIVRDTIRTSIPQDGSIIFTFSELANFPRGDHYDNFTCGIDLEGDEDASNDKMVKDLYIQDSYTPPAFQDFEFSGGVWIPSKSGSWECVVSDGTIPVLPESPNSWILSTTGEYPVNDTAYLTSGCYDLTNATRNIISLKYWIQSNNGEDGMAFEYSTNDGATWQLVDTSVFGRNWGWYTEPVTALGHIGWTGTSGGWVTVKEMLPASLATEPKVKFRVKWMSGAVGGGLGPAIDDFEVYSAPADVGVSSIASPIDDCELQNSSSTSVYVKNYGFNSMITGDTIIVGVDFESEPSVIDTFSLSSDLAPGDSVLLTVGTDYDITTAGTYDILAYTLIEDDPFLYQTNNDTAWKTFTIWPNPPVILADTIGSRDPDTVNIVPQYPDWEPGYTYLWQPGSVTDSIYDVSLHGYGPRVYNLTVTEPVHNCVTEDSVNVLLLYFDAGADEVVYPVSTCELTASELVTVRVKNTGTDSLLIGDQIQVHFRVNGGTIHKDTITLDKNLHANQTIEHTFVNDPYDFSAYDTYYIDAWAHFGSGDTTATNDSTFAVVETFGFTPLDLGPDLTIEDTSYTLDAGAGFISYLWSTGDTTQTTYINTSGTYWVDAWDVNGCPANDTISVWFKVRDIMAYSLMAPITSCEREDDNLIQFVVRNNGTDTIKTAETLTYSYSLNGGARVVQSASPSADILPGAQYMYIFSGAIDMSEYKDYNFDLTVTSTDDIDTANDTLNVTVATYKDPVVDLGEDRVVTGIQELLNADNGAGHSYLWQDNSTAATFTAIMTGTYSCVVTNITTGCSAGDTVVLTFDYADYSISSITIRERPCQGNAEDMDVTIAYNQGSNARTNTTLSVGYQTGSDEVVTEDVTIDELWMPGESKTVSIINEPKFSESGTLPLRVYLNGVNDLDPTNDEYTKNLDVQAMPEVDFGGDTVGVYFPHILDPGQFTSYQWQDNSIERYYTATITGQYTVTVTNAAGCPATESVFLSDGLYYNGAAEDNLEVNLYPNPTNDVLNIKAKVLTNKEITIELLDISNRVVFSDKHKGVGTYFNKLDVANIVSGVYFLRIRNAEIYFVNRIVIH